MIEVLRFVSLFLLIIIHTDHIIIPKTLPFISAFIVNQSAYTFGVSMFVVITSIFTVGKGKEYFLRNLSRFLFVIVIVAAIGIPLYYTHDVNIARSHYDALTFAFGGRDTWYLWGICFSSLFVPFIKLDRFIKSNPYTYTFIGLVLIIAPQVPQLLYKLQFARILLPMIGAYFLFVAYQNSRFTKNRSIFWLIVPIFIAQSCFAWFLDMSVFCGLFATMFVMWLTTFNFKTPSWINKVVRHSYFVYELHFIFQIVWLLIMRSELNQFDSTTGKVFFPTQGWLWVEVIFVFAASLVSSVIVTWIQYYIWEPIIGNKILYKIKPYGSLYLIIAVMFILCYSVNLFL